MGESALETELKFDLPAGARLPRFKGSGPIAEVSSARRMTQTAVYYDTPDLALLDAKHTLRRRTGGTDSGWHLKTPGGTGEGGVLLRREFHEPAGSARSPIPSTLRAAVAPIIDREVLLPVCVLRTVRVRRRLLDADGTLLALVEDDTVEAWRPTDLRGSAGEGGTVSWREVEVELADPAAPGTLEAVRSAFARAGLQPSPAPSKLARALDELGLRPGPSVAVPPQVSLEADPSGARLAVWRYAAAQLGVVQALTEPVLQDAPDAVHKMRVATRRLRATLRTIRPWLDRDATQRVRRQVRWLTRVLAGARDGEVVRERILSELDELPRRDVRAGVRRRLRRELDATHAAAHAEAVDALESARYARLLATVADFLLDLPWRRRSKRSLHDLLMRATQRVEARALLADAAETPVEREFELHEVRKKGKAARYAVEAATKWAPEEADPGEPEENENVEDSEANAGPEQAGESGQAGEANAGAAEPPPADDPASELAAWVDLQELLGDYQDAVVAREVLRRYAKAAQSDGQDTYTYGVLVGRETQRLLDSQARVDKALRRALGARESAGGGAA